MVVADVTPSERLKLVRLRRKLTQAEMADELGVSIDIYRKWESGRRPGVPSLPLGQLERHEVCRLLRLRKRQTQRELAAEIGVSRLWVMKMESGEAPVQRLTTFWGASCD